MITLSTTVSEAVVQSMAESRGEAAVREILKVTSARYRALISGRGRLTADQLTRIEKNTGKTWQRWILSAGGKRVKTRQGKQFHDRMLAAYDKLESFNKALDGTRPRVKSAPHRSTAADRSPRRQTA